MENPVPSSAQKYKNSQGIEVDDYPPGKKWGYRLGFYAFYYLIIYGLYLWSIKIITGRTHAPDNKVPITQGRLGSPRMTLFPLDQIREIDWIPRSGVDNHLWYKSDTLRNKVSMREAYKNLLAEKLDNLKDKNFTASVIEFCEGDYLNFKNGKACFLVGVNTAVNWEPIKLDLTKENNWFDVKLSKEGAREQFDLASQGLNYTEDADVYFQCRVFETNFDADAGVCRPVAATAGLIMGSADRNHSGIEWMNGENYLKNYQPFQGGWNPKGDDLYEKCFQPSFSAADCNINQYDYQTWNKPMTAVKIDLSAIDEEFQELSPTDNDQKGYEFKCNAYAQNIIAPIYVESEKFYYEGDNGEPVVQSGGRDLHQNFIIQF